MIRCVAVLVVVIVLLLCAGIVYALTPHVRARVGGLVLVFVLAYVSVGIAIAVLGKHLPSDDAGAYTSREFVR